MNEYNQISNILRAQMERELGAPSSNTFTELGQVAGKDETATTVVDS